MINNLLAGNVNGIGTQARFDGLNQIVANSSNNNILFVIDSNNNCIRRCDATTRAQTAVTTFLNSSDLNNPIGLVISSDLKYFYCSSQNGNRLFKIDISTATIIATYGTCKYYYL